MSISTGARVIRNNKPKRNFTQNTYWQAKPYLLKDFGQRCAYSLQHVEKVGTMTMEVDHHNPTLKSSLRNQYENLYPATRHCNGSKRDKWPSKEAQAGGVRFLDPCKEMDYGQQIFEDPVTHRLEGTTPAAKYHISVLGLNAPFLIIERADRANLRRVLTETGVTIPQYVPLISEAYETLKAQAERMIPPIPPPPLQLG